MIWRSPHPDVAIPDVLLPHAVVAPAAAAYGDAPALVDAASGRTLGYAELWALVRRCAAGLAARGIHPGDVVGLLAPNLPEYAVAFHGTALAGAAATTINPLYTVEEIRFQLRDAGARLLVTVPPFAARAVEAAHGTGVAEVLVIGGRGEEGTTPFAALLEAGDEPPALDLDPAAALVSLPYSSGTTGLPKGVRLTHRNLVANVLQSETVLACGPGDVTVAVLPFFHIYGQTVVLNLMVRRGTTVVTMPRFDLEGFLGLVQERRVTVCCVAPPVVLALARHPLVDRYDLSSLRWLVSGAAPLDADLQAACAARLGCEVVQGYGMTESSPVTHLAPPGAPPRHGTIGWPVAGTEARLVDPATGEDAAPGEPGELWVRGPQVMAGYLNAPAATAATLVDDGWLRTGDIAAVEPDGAFRVVDRLKELIKVSGFQVAPAELEALLVGHPAVADACVVGVPDEAAGEAPKAFVVLRGEADPAEIAAWVAERVASYKRLRAVEVVDEIPKSASGKILRRVLKERDAAAGR